MSKRIQIMVSDADFADWTAKAHALRLSLSGYIRARVMMGERTAQRAAEAKQEPPQATEKPRLVCDVCRREGRITGCPRCANLNA